MMAINPTAGPVSAEALLKRFRVAESRKRLWEGTYSEALAYAAPQRDSFAPAAVGSKRSGFGKVYDATAMVAYQKFVSNLQSSLVPPFKKWVNLVPGRLLPPQTDETLMAKALQAIRDAMFTYLHMSNFDTQIAEAFYDLGLGTAALLVQQGQGTRALQFTAVPLSQLYLEEGSNATIGAVFRKHQIPARTIAATWPDAELGDTLQRLIKEAPDTDVELIEATIPDENAPHHGWIYAVVEPKSKSLLLNRTQPSNPWVVFRYSVMPGEVYGRGPLLLALPDIKTLNKTKELILKNASLAVAGAYTVADDGVVNVEAIRIQPGALIPVSSNGGGVSGPTIAPLPRSGDFSVAQIVLEDLRRSINGMLFADALGPVDLPTKSATEVTIRQQELARQIGSAFGRLQFELIGPLVSRVLYLLDVQGLVDLSDFVVDGGDIAIQPVSPLAQAQDEGDLANLLRYGQTMVQLFGPQLGLLLTKPDIFAREVGALLGVKADVMPTAEEMDTLRQVAAHLLQGVLEGSAHAPA